MKRLLFCSLTLLVAAVVFHVPPACAAQRSIRVLFIGNNLTSANDLPAMVADMAKARGHDLQYDSFAPGGYRLLEHAKDPASLAKIRKGNWDFVMLQEHGQSLEFSRSEIAKFSDPYVAQLSQVIRTASPQAAIVLYMTMARKSGDPGNVNVSPELKTYTGMQHRVNNAYLELARRYHALIAPVGRVWEDLRAQNPAIELYADEAHPNLTGSYLAACVVYEVLFKENSQGLPHPKGIEDTTAALIQKITHQTAGAQRWDFR